VPATREDIVGANGRDLSLLAQACREQVERFPPGNDSGVLGIGYGWIARRNAWTGDFGVVFLSLAGQPGVADEAVRVGAGVDVACCCFPIEPFALQPPPPPAGADALPLRVGSPIRSSVAAGGVGALIGRRALSAAHVFGAEDTAFSAGGLTAGSAVHIDRRVDAALLQVNPAIALAGLTPDGTAVTGIRDPIEEDFDRPGLLYSPWRGRTFKPYLLAGNLTLYFPREGIFTGMLMTESCTVRGDSGTALLGIDGAVLGLLSHGGPQFSFFTSITAIRKLTGWF